MNPISNNILVMLAFQLFYGQSFLLIIYFLLIKFSGFALVFVYPTLDHPIQWAKCFSMLFKPNALYSKRNQHARNDLGGENVSNLERLGKLSSEMDYHSNHCHLINLIDDLTNGFKIFTNFHHYYQITCISMHTLIVFEPNF